MGKYRPGLGMTLLLIGILGVFSVAFLLGPSTLIGFVIFQGQREGNAIYIPFDSGLYYKLRDDCSFSITDSIGGTELRNGVNILWYRNETDGLNYSTSNFVHEELYNESNTVFHKSCLIDSCFRINVTVSGTENGGIEETRKIEILPGCSDANLIRYFGGIIGQRPKVTYPYGIEYQTTTSTRVTYPFDTIFSPVALETASLNGAYVLFGTNDTTGYLNVSRTGYGFQLAAYNPAGEYIFSETMNYTIYYYASPSPLNYSRYYDWLSQDFMEKAWDDDAIENISYQFSKSYQLVDFASTGYQPQICYAGMCSNAQFAWENVQTWFSYELENWTGNGATYAMIIKQQNGSNSTFSHWNGAYSTYNMNPSWDVVRTIYFMNKSYYRNYSHFFDDMEDVRRDYEPSLAQSTQMNPLVGFLKYAQLHHENATNLISNQWIPRVHLAKYQDNFDYENAETGTSCIAEWTPDNGDTCYWSAIRNADGINRQSRLMDVKKAFSTMNNPPLLTKRSMLSYNESDTNYGIAAALTKQLKIPSSYSLTTRGSAQNVNDSFLIARYQMNDHELPKIESFDYFINDSVGSIPFAHYLYITLYQSPVSIATNAKFYQFDDGPVQTVVGPYITLSGTVGPGHWLKVWKNDLRITNRSGIYFLWGRPASQGYRIDAVSTDWYPYPDGNTVVHVEYDGGFTAFDEKEKEVVGLDGLIDQDIVGEDYKKSYLFFNLTNITLSNNITTIFSTAGIVNTSDKIYLRNQSVDRFALVSNNSLTVNLTFVNATDNCTIDYLKFTHPDASYDVINDYSCQDGLLAVNLSMDKGTSFLDLLRATCTPVVSCSSWSSCLNSSQWRSCDDACGNVTNESQFCTCSESWSCSDWSLCSSSLQSRSCTDSNACGTIANKPAESQSCTAGPAPVTSSGGGGGGGSPFFGKLDIIRNAQNRSKTASKNESKETTPPEESVPEPHAMPENATDVSDVVSQAVEEVLASPEPSKPENLAGQASESIESRLTSLNPLTFGIAGVIVLIIFGSIAFIEHRQSKRLPDYKREELHEFIMQKLEDETPRREIKKDLRGVGWNPLLVNHEMRKVLKDKKAKEKAAKAEASSDVQPDVQEAAKEEPKEEPKSKVDELKKAWDELERLDQK